MINMERIGHFDTLLETAGLWFARAEGNASAEIRVARDTWLSESPEHLAAYRSIERTWVALQSATRDPAIQEMRRQATRRLIPTTSTWKKWAAAALVMLSLGAALWFVVPRTGFDLSPLAWLIGETGNSATHRYATKTGERLTIALDDGSHVTLNTETQLDVTFSKKARTVRLSHGQALFQVAKDRSRPFAVEGENRRFVAVGTVFDVLIEADQVKVTMLEGTVRAESIAPASLTRTTITSGEQLISRAQSEDRVRRVDPERETSWRRGQLIFEDTPLAEAVAELNRYSTAQIELADPKLADLRLSGTFATGGTSAFVEAVTAYFPIKIGHTDERSVTLKARE
jgi:transmembrane sensor